jgi:hypothetical protein
LKSYRKSAVLSPFLLRHNNNTETRTRRKHIGGASGEIAALNAGAKGAIYWREINFVEGEKWR